MKILIGFLVALAPMTAAANKTYNDGKGGTWDCAKDADVSINANDGTYTLKGACRTINVNGNKNQIAVESATQLNVMGNDNKVEAATAEGVHTMGNHNVIAVKSGTPRVNNMGTDNKVTAGGGGASTSGTGTTTSGGPGSPTTVDCAKQPTYTITGGDGTYAFTGTCDKISLTGGSNTLAVEAVKELSVAGTKNTIAVAAADTIVTTGSDNKVSYKKGITGAKPKLTTLGKHNLVEQSK